jgi:hypothetical protein
MKASHVSDNAMKRSILSRLFIDFVLQSMSDDAGKNPLTEDSSQHGSRSVIWSL